MFPGICVGFLACCSWHDVGSAAVNQLMLDHASTAAKTVVEKDWATRKGQTRNDLGESHLTLVLPVMPVCPSVL